MEEIFNKVLDTLSIAIHNIVTLSELARKQQAEIKELKNRLEKLEKLLCNSPKNVV